MEVSDEQVLAQLHLRKTRLMIELKRVEAAILAFEDINNIDELDILDVIHTQQEKPNYEEFQDEIAIATLMYNHKMTYEKKVLYVLGQIKEGDAKQIADYILIVDTKMAAKDIKALYARVTYVTSKNVQGRENRCC